MMLIETNKTHQTSSNNGGAKTISRSRHEEKEFSFLKRTYLRKIANWSFGYLNQNQVLFSDKFQKVKIGTLLTRSKTAIKIQDDEIYKQVTIKLYGKGAKLRDDSLLFGREIKTKSQFLVKEGQFLLSRIDARNGAFAIATKEIDGAIVTNDFPVYDIDQSLVNPNYFSLLISTERFASYFQGLSSGTTNRQRMNEADFLEYQIPLPLIDSEDKNAITQKKLVTDYNAKILQAESNEKEAAKKEKEIEAYLLKELGIKIQQTEKKKGLQIARLKDLNQWGFDKILNPNSFISNKYELVKFENNSILFDEVFRGKSPKYDEKSNDKILNQKCVRWNEIILDYAKGVESNWKNSINSKFFTKENDILINSTGEGTIGRSAIVGKLSENLLIDSHILLLRLNTKFIKPEFFIAVFNNSFGQIQINNIKSAQSTKQTELGIDNLLKLEFPIPPLKIQNKIVKHINSIKSQIKTLKSEAEDLRNAAKNEFEAELFEL